MMAGQVRRYSNFLAMVSDEEFGRAILGLVRYV
jgi:hypothetical protein